MLGRGARWARGRKRIVRGPRGCKLVGRHNQGSLLFVCRRCGSTWQTAKSGLVRECKGVFSSAGARHRVRRFLQGRDPAGGPRCFRLEAVPRDPDGAESGVDVAVQQRHRELIVRGAGLDDSDGSAIVEDEAEW